MKNSGKQINMTGGAGVRRACHTSREPESVQVERPLAALHNAAVVASIGQTPLVRLRRIERWLGLPDDIEILLKCEWTNPGGSIKDRTALSIVRAALIEGKLGDGQTLVDSTSGNTGIAYAMLG